MKWVETAKMTPLVKKLKPYQYGFCAMLIVTGAVVLRLILIALQWPPTNSDEAIMNLMAMHIAEKGEQPIFFYGQNYLGALEAYIGALMFRIIGMSLFSMRLGAILLYSGFLVCMYFIVSRVYTKRLAILIMILLGLGTQWVFGSQLLTAGYTPLPFLCALLFLLSYQLARSQGVWYWRVVLYLLWGIVAGLAIWAHLIVAPYVLVSGILLLLGWKEFLKYGAWCAVLGLVIGAWPLISYDLHAAPGQDSLHTFENMSWLGANNHYPPKSYIYGPLVVTLPASLGLGPTCYIKQLPFNHLVYPQTQTCLLEQAIYGFGYVVLLIIAVLMALVGLFIVSRRYREKPELVRQWACLMLLVGAGLTLIVFAHSPTSIFTGVLGVRYLICTLVSLPAVLWPIWKGIDRVRSLPITLRLPLIMVRFGLIAFICVTSLRATMHIFDQIPAAQADYQKLTQLANRLEQMHITRFYSEYWTCNTLIFQTQEKLVCADTWGNLTHGYDRYKDYHTMVNANPNPDFVYADGSKRIPELEKALKSTHTLYQRIEVAGYMIYIPAHRIPGVKLYQM